MAAEFLVMAELHSRGLDPALTMGNAKSLDIFVRNEHGKLIELEVKASKGGGKFGVGAHDYSWRSDLYFVFVYFERFPWNNEHAPRFFIVPASDVERMKERWENGFAVFYYKRNGGLDRLRGYETWDPIVGIGRVSS